MFANSFISLKLLLGLILTCGIVLATENDDFSYVIGVNENYNPN